jgi:sigma-B regulation protein RsbU (phosphoserine phosphatase)
MERAGARWPIDEELRVAQRIQRSLVLLPKVDLEGWEIASDYRPAREIGGDFFDAFPVLGADSPSRLCVVIADVSGKGISAAMLMAFLRPLVRAAMDHTGDPVEALERTNRILVDERRTGLFVTMLCGVMEPDGAFRFASAGHELPLLVPGDGSSPREVPGGGPLIGLVGRLELREEVARLDPGDALVLYTDGVTDAARPDGQRYGEARLREILEGQHGASAAQLVARVVESVTAFQGPAPAADDLALLVVRRSAAARPSGGPSAAGTPAR